MASPTPNQGGLMTRLSLSECPSPRILICMNMQARSLRALSRMDVHKLGEENAFPPGVARELTRHGYDRRICLPAAPHSVALVFSPLRQSHDCG